MSNATASLVKKPGRNLEDRALAAEARIDVHLQEKHGATKALQAAIEAIELLMQARSQAKSPEQKMRLKSKIEQLMGRAEVIKGVQKKQEEEEEAMEEETQEAMARVSLAGPDIPILPNAKAQAVLKAPQSNRTLSNREQMVVLRSSKVAEHIFPPWTKEPSQSEFNLGGLFTRHWKSPSI